MAGWLEVARASFETALQAFTGRLPLPATVSEVTACEAPPPEARVVRPMATDEATPLEEDGMTTQLRMSAEATAETALAAAFARATGAEDPVPMAEEPRRNLRSVTRGLADRARRPAVPSTPAREVDVTRTVMDVRPRGAEGTAGTVRSEVLAWLHGRCGGILSNDAHLHGDLVMGGGEVTASASRVSDDGADVWSTRLVEPGRAVEVVVVDRPGRPTRVTVRVTSTSDEPDATTPDVLRRLAHRFTLLVDGCELDLAPTLVEGEAEAEALCELLVDPDRTWPVFVLSIPFEAGATLPLVDADALAAATCGMAATFVLPADMTWTLTRRFDKTRSVHSGAARTYMPGFDGDDDVYAHPLTLPGRLATEEARRAFVSRSAATASEGSLSNFRMGRDVRTHASYAALARRSEVVGQVSIGQVSIGLPTKMTADGPRTPSPRPTLALVPSAPPVAAAKGGESPEDAGDAHVADLEAELASLRREARLAREELAQTVAERDAARAIAASSGSALSTAEAGLSLSESHVAHLRETLRNRGAAEWEVASPPPAWDAVPEWVASNLGGMVALAPLARRNLRDATFEDLALVHRCLLWLAGRATGTAGTLLDAIVEPGVRVRPCGGDAFAFDDGTGRRLTADWHVKAGGNTRDPRRCLRIYFAWDAAARTFVIADMPGHRDSLVS